MSVAVSGIDAGRVGPWLEAHVPGLVGPCRYDLIAGGHSNLTYEVVDSTGQSFVLRRPPLSTVLATAHDMSREHRLISALGPTPVPVPPALAFCDDAVVNDAPFYVMGFVEGHVLRDAASLEAALDPAARQIVGESLVEVLAAIHEVDPDAVGLGDLGRRQGYVERQLRRWHTQFEASATRDLPVVHDVHARLVAAAPEQGPATIVHGDYRLDNCIVGDDGQVRAVLDWEICTLGDPLADVGLLLVYWGAPDRPAALLDAPTAAPGLVDRDTLLARYAERSGLDVSGIDYYIAFGYWKLACIIEGVYARYLAGAMGDASGYEGFAAQAERLAEAARLTLDEAGL